MNRRWINTRVEFIWDGSQYVEQYSEGYWYDGEMALCTSTTIIDADGGTVHYDTEKFNSAGSQFSNNERYLVVKNIKYVHVFAGILPIKGKNIFEIIKGLFLFPIPGIKKIISI